MFRVLRCPYKDLIKASGLSNQRPTLKSVAAMYWPTNSCEQASKADFLSIRRLLLRNSYVTYADNVFEEKFSTAPTHYNDWPNSQGFNTCYEENSPIELKVEGHIPNYATGTLFRTGPGPRTVDCDSKEVYSASHWFDGFAQVHRFQIQAADNDGVGSRIRITYNSRLVCDGTINKIKETGRFDGYTFAAKYEPCKSLFQKLQSFFQLPNTSTAAADEVQVNVTMSVNLPGLSSDGQSAETKIDDSNLNTLWNKTDSCQMQSLDPETLEPIGVALQTVLHPDLKGPISAAHAKSDPRTGDVYNFNLDFGRVGTYRIFVTSASTGKTTILATFYHTASYMHSFWLTENYIVLCAWNSYFVGGGTSILWNKNVLDALGYDDKNPAKWFVVDRKPEIEGGKGLIATYESDPFFAFHTVNAFEERNVDGGMDIVADVPAYDSIEVLNKFYYDNLLSDSPQSTEYVGKWKDKLNPKLRRYRLSNIPQIPRAQALRAQMQFEAEKVKTPELPCINWSKVTKRHRYVYGVLDSGKSTFLDSIIKYDMDTDEALIWSEHGQTAGEAIFIADPDSEDEDAGVLLTVVMDGMAGKSYLLVLDARNLTELGRAYVHGVIGHGFHGLHTRQGVPGSSATSRHV